MSTDVSEEHIASIFRVEEQAEQETSSGCHLLSGWFLARLILRPWRWRQYVPPKRRVTYNALHGVISQMIVFFKTISYFYNMVLSTQKREKIDSAGDIPGLYSKDPRFVSRLRPRLPWRFSRFLSIYPKISLDHFFPSSCTLSDHRNSFISLNAK
jgi:hypothetical protein